MVLPILCLMPMMFPENRQPSLLRMVVLVLGVCPPFPPSPPPPTYLASAESPSCVLPPHFGSCPLHHYEEAITVWSQAYKQKCWDAPHVAHLAKSLLDRYSNSYSRACLASCKEPGAWLNALPISSLGLHRMVTLFVLL